MGTRTVDETGTGAGAGPEHDGTAVDATESRDVDAAETRPEATKDAPESEDRAPSGVGQGAAAVVSAALGLVSLTGSWLGTVAAARETLLGQLETAADAGVATQVKEIYGDAWHTSALWGGLFALTALIVGVVVLARPAFGTPGRTVQAPWTKSVAWAGVSLGVVGLLLAVLKYTDVLLGLPATG
ncbi:membrane protein [Streptomyces caelestis]|uniref:Membrane protein n=2 Tax=Streptomyces TaxID=1883 RepID=A0A0M8QD06_9ACTN|nr:MULTISPECIES: hypothetical protein [Streptomyces]KOT27536.1 membrane protein [Streptomyces caelestis]KOV31338.1 membrane protein [Streptomyces sp. XY152]